MPKQYVEEKFELSKKLVQEIGEWMDIQEKKNDTIPFIGGRYSYTFIPTSVGMLLTITDEVMNEEYEALGPDSLAI